MRAPPSLRTRAVVALAFLVGFYVTMLGTAAALFAAVPLYVRYRGEAQGALSVLCTAFTWLPAMMLLRAIGSVRPPQWREPGRRLARDEAPELFHIVEDLAQQAKTAPPTELYVTALVDLGVTETGGLFGKSRRVLVLGVPLLAMIDVGELRAALAHELGHFTGGETRLSGIVSYTLAAFRGVTASVAAQPPSRLLAVRLTLGLGRGLALLLVHGYTQLFLRVTSPGRRRQELAADAMAAAHAGRENLRRALEKLEVGVPTYERYVTQEVAEAVLRGGMPEDLLDGYRLFRERFLGTDAGRAFEAEVRARTTHPHDTHPAVRERLRLVASLPEGEAHEDRRNALSLVDVPPATEPWLVGATLALFDGRRPQGPVRRLPWSRIPGEIIAPALVAGAARVATSLLPLFPEAKGRAAMLDAAVGAVAEGRAGALVAQLEPSVVRLPPTTRIEVVAAGATTIVTALLEAVILERGGVIDDSLGLPHALFRLDGEHLAPRVLAESAIASREGLATLRALVQRLAH
jgi:heat shock protein HtpX